MTDRTAGRGAGGGEERKGEWKTEKLFRADIVRYIKMNINQAIDLYLNGKDKSKGRKPEERYSSFDYCYNYFFTFYQEKKIPELADNTYLQESCLQLGFYLASWGMMRGSSFLLEKSVRNYKDLITAISKMNPIMWKIDVDNYTEENIKHLLDCKQKIRKALGTDNNPSDILVTKIMLGVFANIPAFDQNVRKSFSVYSVTKNSLRKIRNFYEDNRDVFDSHVIHTFNFLTGQETKIVYTKAKLIDMFGFMDGQEKISAKKKEAEKNK